MEEQQEKQSQSAAGFRDSFSHGGKEYRLFKRDKTKEAPWYFQVQRDGKRFLRCLESNQKAAAIVNARRILGAIKEERWEALEGAKHRQAPAVKLATIGEVVARYEELGRTRPDLWKLQTVAGNIVALRALLRAVYGADENGFMALSTEVLTKDLVARFKSAVVSSAPADELAMERRMRTGNSYLRQGRSVFAKHVVELYEVPTAGKPGLRLPDLREFMEATGFRRVRKKQYDPPSAELIAETFRRLGDGPESLRWQAMAAKERLKILRAAAGNSGTGARTEAEELAAVEAQNIYAAICLALGTGMRKSEIARMRWEWFVERLGPRGAQMFLRSEFLDKKGAQVDLPVLGEWWEQLARLRPESGEGFVLEGAMTERTEKVFRRIAAWMRGIGWRTQKAIHEFRAYVGSKIAETHGIEAASMFLRHEQLSTTKQSYMRYVKMGALDVRLLAGVNTGKAA